MLDSSSDGKLIHPHDHFVSMTVEIAGRAYKDGKDLRAQKFYKLLASTEEFPKTSQPSPEDFAECFQQVKDTGDELVYLCLSSSLSGTYQSATIAKDLVEYDHIYIVDTLAASHMIGQLARYAQQLVQQGLSGQEIAEKVGQLRDKQVLYAGLQTLEYLYKGGRLSRASAAIGTIANIKPIITLNKEGKVESFAKAIGVKRAIQTIVKQVQAHEIDTDFEVWSLYTAEEENCEAMEQALAQAGIYVAGRMQVGPTIGAHIGPGAYGILFVEK